MIQTIIDFPVLNVLARGEMDGYALVRNLSTTQAHLIYATLRRLRKDLCSSKEDHTAVKNLSGY